MNFAYERAKARMPELPAAKKMRLVQAYGISAYQAGVLASDAALSDYFEKAADSGTERICRILVVISSPATPSPRVTPLNSRSFSYISEILAPSNFGSMQ